MGRQRVAPRLRGFARRLRREATPAERRLWGALRSRRFAAFKFRRQVPIGAYVADFACYDARLVIELDGSQHIDNQRDRERDAALSERGFEVLRVWNNELLRDEAAVLEAIWQALDRRSGVPGSPSPGAARHPLSQGQAVPVARQNEDDAHETGRLR